MTNLKGFEGGWKFFWDTGMLRCIDYISEYAGIIYAIKTWIS